MTLHIAHDNYSKLQLAFSYYLRQCRHGVLHILILVSSLPSYELLITLCTRRFSELTNSTLKYVFNQVELVTTTTKSIKKMVNLLFNQT